MAPDRRRLAVASLPRTSHRRPTGPARPSARRGGRAGRRANYGKMPILHVTSFRRTAAALLVILVWSACFVVIKATQADAPPLLYAALRALLGGFPLLAVAAWTGKARPPSGSWAWLALLGLTNTTLGLGGMFLSTGAVGAAIPGVLANSQALLVAPFAALLFREALTPGRVAGLVLGLSGIALTLPAGGPAVGNPAGTALALLSAAGLAAGSLVIKHVGPRVDALTATAWQYVLGGVALLGWSLAVDDAGAVRWSAPFAAGLLFLGLVGSAGASWVWYRLLRDGELIALNGLTLLTPAFALLLAVLVSRERLGTLQGLGVAVVLVGATWVGWPRSGLPGDHGKPEAAGTPVAPGAAPGHVGRPSPNAPAAAAESPRDSREIAHGIPVAVTVTMMRIMLLFLLLIGLVAGPVLCGPSLALAAHADQVGVGRALDTHAIDACDDQAQPPATAGSPLVLAAPSLTAVDVGLAPAALHLLGNALIPHSPVHRRTPLRL